MSLMSAAQSAANRFGIVRELMTFFWERKRWWLVPMLVALFLFGALIILAQSSAVGPFIYTLF